MATKIPTTCKAVVATKYGKPQDVIQIINDHPVPSPKPNEVLVKVAGSSVNPLDWKVLLGNLAMMGKMTFPYVIGCDFSGTVAAVGSACMTRKVGDKVYGLHDSFKQGVMAEYIVKEEQNVNIAPSNIPLAEASSIPMVYITSYQSLLKQSGLKKGDNVLIIGGSSGTGAAAVQIAKAVGASTVAATCSSRNVDFVKSLGADVVIARDKQEWSDVLAGQQYSLVLDCVGESEYYTKAHKILKPRGTYTSLNFAGSSGVDPSAKFSYGSIISIVMATVPRKIKQLFGGLRYNATFADADSPQARKDIDIITQWFEQGKCKLTIEKVYSYKDTVAMYDANIAGRTRGKLVASFDQ